MIPAARSCPSPFAAFRTVAASALRTLQQSDSRRRLVMLAAAILVCSYALAVLAYVASIPDIGLRSAFTPTVTQFYPDYVRYSDADVPDLLGSRILQVGNHPIDMWPQFLRALIHLRDESWQEDLEDALPTGGAPYIRYRGEPLVRVRLRAPTGPEYTVWCRMGRPPLESF